MPKCASCSLVVALVVFLSLSGVSHALTYEQKALVGLKGVYVLIEDIDPQAERLGITRSQIGTDVELRLRKAGVRVLTKEERLETQGMPYLYVRVSSVVNQDIPLVAYNIHMALSEEVTLARGLQTSGTIWHTSATGTLGKQKTGRIRELAGDRVDEFINDYLAANPK